MKMDVVFSVLGKLASRVCCFFFSVVLLAFASHPTGKRDFVCLFVYLTLPIQPSAPVISLREIL